MRFLFFVFSFIPLLLQCHGVYVIQLNEKNFDTYTRSGTWFIQFYAPWCGLCKKSLKIFEELGKKMRHEHTHVNIGIINGDNSPMLNRRLGLKNDYPIYLFFAHGGEGSYIKYEYKKLDVSVKHFEQFIHDHSFERRQQDQEHITLRYFNCRGRAEIIRLTLEASGLPYEQVLHSSEEWPAIKEAGIASGTLLFGQVPAIRIDQRDLVQSAAIVRYIGSKYGLIPPEHQTEIDILMGGVEDLYKRYSDLVYDKEYAAKKDNYLNNVLPVWLGHFERYLSKTSSPYLVGNTLTVADLSLFDLVTFNMDLSTDCLENFPLLKKHVVMVAIEEPIKNYITSDRRPSNANCL